MKENLKPYVYKQSKHDAGATACLLKNEPASYFFGEVKRQTRSRSESESEEGAKSKGIDPKPQ